MNLPVNWRNKSTSGIAKQGKSAFHHRNLSPKRIAAQGKGKIFSGVHFEAVAFKINSSLDWQCCSCRHIHSHMQTCSHCRRKWGHTQCKLKHCTRWSALTCATFSQNDKQSQVILQVWMVLSPCPRTQPNAKASKPYLMRMSLSMLSSTMLLRSWLNLSIDSFNLGSSNLRPVFLTSYEE